MFEALQFAAELLSNSAKGYAVGAVERQLAADPKALDGYGGDHHDLVGDTELRYRNLAEAVCFGRPALFVDFVCGLAVSLTARNSLLEVLSENLEAMAEELRVNLPGIATQMPVSILDEAREALASAPRELPSTLASEAPHGDLARRYLLAVLEARADDAVDLVLDAHESGIAAPELHSHVLLVGQRELGRMWQMNEIHVAEEHVGSRIAERAMNALRERVRGDRSGPRVLCASVAGDLHDLGIRAVADHLSWANFDAVLLGASTPAPDMVLSVTDFEPDVLALSASVALHVRTTASLIGTLRERCDPVPKLVVGGGPFVLVDDLWHLVGADAHAGSPEAAVDVVRELTGQS